MKTHLNLERLDERVLPSLTPVAPAPGSPLAAVVQVQAIYPDGQVAVGTGALIDSTHVLTSGHLLYSAGDGGYAISVAAVSGAGAASGAYERVDPSWVSFSAGNPGLTSPSVADVGLVTLNSPLGNSTGWFTLGSASDNALAGTNFQTAGFPGVPGLAAQLFFSSGPAAGAASTNGIAFAQNSLTVLPGQSGAPLWANVNGSPVLYGVVTGASGLSPADTGYATRITDAVFGEVQAWRLADLTPGWTSRGLLQHPDVPAVPPQSSPSVAPAIHALDYYDLNGNYVYTGPQFVPYYPTNPEPTASNPWIDGMAAGNAAAWQFYQYYTQPWTMLAPAWQMFNNYLSAPSSTYTPSFPYDPTAVYNSLYGPDPATFDSHY